MHTRRNLSEWWEVSAYVVFEYITGYEGLVDRGVLVGFEVYESFVGNAFMRRDSCENGDKWLASMKTTTICLHGVKNNVSRAKVDAPHTLLDFLD